MQRDDYYRTSATSLPQGLGKYAVRSVDTLMERIRQADPGDLSARLMSGLLRGLMFVHMKAGLDADPIQLDFPTDAYTIRRSGLTPSGVRGEFQQALAELRTDLDAFTADGSESLMALGYQMTAEAFVHRSVRCWGNSPNEASSATLAFCREAQRNHVNRGQHPHPWGAARGTPGRKDRRAVVVL